MYALKIKTRASRPFPVPMQYCVRNTWQTRFEFLTSLPKIYQPVAKTTFNFFSWKAISYGSFFLNQEMVSYQLHFIKILTVNREQLIFLLFQKSSIVSFFIILIHNSYKKVCLRSCIFLSNWWIENPRISSPFFVVAPYCDFTTFLTRKS
jgi:hypothetical protein